MQLFMPIGDIIYIVFHNIVQSKYVTTLIYNNYDIIIYLLIFLNIGMGSSSNELV